MDTQIAHNFIDKAKGREAFESVSKTYDELPKNLKTDNENSLAGKQKMFINVIAAAMKNPSPLSQKDPEDTIMQMMQMHQIDSSERTVDAVVKLKEEILKLVKFGQASIQGKEVKIKSNLLITQDGKAKFEFDNPQDLQQLKITISTDTGKPIKTIEIEPEINGKPNPLLTKGQHIFEWDGKDMHDCEVPMGPNNKYRINLIAKGGDGKFIKEVPTSVIGTVDGIDFKTKNSDIKIGSQIFPIEMLEISQQSKMPENLHNGNNELLSAINKLSDSLKPEQIKPLDMEIKNAIYG